MYGAVSFSPILAASLHQIRTLEGRKRHNRDLNPLWRTPRLNDTPAPFPLVYTTSIIINRACISPSSQQQFIETRVAVPVSEVQSRPAMEASRINIRASCNELFHDGCVAVPRRQK